MRAPFRPLTDWERRMQRLRIWLYEFSDDKVMAAAFLFLIAVTIWFQVMAP